MPILILVCSIARLACSNQLLWAFRKPCTITHHIGNNDRIGENGETVDWISFYQHGKNGEPEHVLTYSFLSFFRDDPKRISVGIKRLNPFLAKFAWFELALVVLCLLHYF